MDKQDNVQELKTDAMFQFLRQLWILRGKSEELSVDSERLTIQLMIDNIPSLIDKLYEHQKHVIVRIEGVVFLGMFELYGLQELLVKNNYSEVTLVAKSYGYELEVPSSLER